jgi:hypothetical protein
LRSSFTGASLQRTLVNSSGLRIRLRLITLLLGIPSGGAFGQAPAFHPPAELPDLPQFTLRQIVMRRNEALMHIPGPWFRAATALVPESLTVQAYRAAASRSGIEPLRGAALRAERSQHVMGLYRRAELLEASRLTLESIRGAITSDSVRARFDALFRPNGEWIVDLHDAALAWSRSRAPNLDWRAASPGLIAAHWVAPQDSMSDEALPRALYGLAVLASNDSTAFAAAASRIWRVDTAAANATLLLLAGYKEGRRWYAEAIDFFLREPWIPRGDGMSIRDCVLAEWQSAFDRRLELPAPHIQPRWFGYPQAVPRYGVPSALFRQLVVANNSSATHWLARQGEPNLLRTLNRLPAGDTSLALLRAGSETFRLTTVPRQSRETLNGFLEPQDAIAIDPGYSPLLALGAIVHEWQHLLFRRLQLETLAESLAGRAAPTEIDLPGVQPYLAEGFAEWSAERILAPVVERWPLLGVGELEKRADLVQRGTDDQHTLGYALVRAVAVNLPNPSRATALLITQAEQPSRIAAHPALRKAWSRYRGAPDRALPGPSYGTLIPEVTFTVEDGVPDVLATRILLQAGTDAVR